MAQQMSFVRNQEVVWSRLIPSGNDQNEASSRSKEIAESPNGHLRPLKTYLAPIWRDRSSTVHDDPDDIRSV